MLFDLRGRRRRAVKVVYATLAILMGGGLVLFGIGGDTQGGLFDAFREDSQRGGGEVDERIQNQIDAAERAVAATPRRPERWVALARLRFQSASIGDGYDQNTGLYTDEGKRRLRSAAQAWDRYLALKPKDPDDRVAALMVQAFGPAGLADFDRAVTAQEIVTEEREGVSREQRSNLFAQLAVLAYQADQERKGDLAADRAVDLAEDTQKGLLRQQIERVKEQVEKARGGTSPSPQGATTSP